MEGEDDVRCFPSSDRNNKKGQVHLPAPKKHVKKFHMRLLWKFEGLKGKILSSMVDCLELK